MREVVDAVHLPTNDDIRCTFTDLTKHSVISYIDHFLDERTAYGHIYTSPYAFVQYEYVSNNLPNDLFRSVRYVSLFDERPFEHSFFLRLAQSFPSMTKWRWKIEQHRRRINGFQSSDILLSERYLSVMSMMIMWNNSSLTVCTWVFTQVNWNEWRMIICEMKHESTIVRCNHFTSSRKETGQDWYKVSVLFERNGLFICE